MVDFPPLLQHFPMVTPSAGDLCGLEWVQLDGELYRKRASCDTLGNGGE